MPSSLSLDSAHGDELLAALAFIEDFDESSLDTVAEQACDVVDNLDNGGDELFTPSVPADDELTALEELDLPSLLAFSDSDEQTWSDGSELHASSKAAERPEQSAPTASSRATEQLQQQLASQHAHRRSAKKYDRPNDKLAALRKQAKQLEAQLETHQIRKQGRDIAKNQGDLRLEAERENEQLKLVLERQVRIAKSLKKHLRRAVSTQAIERCVAANKVQRMLPVIQHDSDAMIIDDLLAGLEQLYTELDAVYEVCGLAEDSETSSVTARMRSHGRDSLQLEIAGTKVLPFDFETTVSAVWDHYVFGKERIASRVYYNKAPKVFLRASYSYIKTFHVEVYAKSTSANFSVKQVLRRYDEADRVVLVLCSSNDPIEYCHEPLADLGFLEKAYIVIKKPSAAAAGSTDGGEVLDVCTVMQALHVITPAFYGEWAARNERHPKLAAMADFVLTLGAANMQATHQRIEDELMQLAIQRQSV